MSRIVIGQYTNILPEQKTKIKATINKTYPPKIHCLYYFYTMIIIYRNETSPQFNIAAEEYVLKHFTEDVLMLWQSEPSVIVGKHQNIMAEVNLKYTLRNNIPVIRRISGGGTVYHDFGNLNYTLIKTETNRERLIDFKNFLEPILHFLKNLDLNTGFQGKNNLVVNGRKFSGNSAHVFKNRVMHHGTLLFDTDLDKLEKVIGLSKATITDKAIKSIRATVTNIADELPVKMSFTEFKRSLTTFLFNYYNIKTQLNFTEADRAAINTLINEKYATAQWTYGYSPAYKFENQIGGNHLKLHVKKGFIEMITIEGSLQNFSSLFLNRLHQYESIKNIVEKEKINLAQKQLLFSLFGF